MATTLTAIFSAQDKLSGVINNMAGSSGKLSSVLAGLGKVGGVAFGAVIKGVTAASAAVGSLLTATVAVGSTFETAFKGVTKTVDFDGANIIAAQMEQELVDLSTVIPIIAPELANIAAAAGQLGISTDGVVAFTKTMANLGVSTNLASDEAATALAQFANVMQMNEFDDSGVSNYERLGSTIVALGNNFATTERDIVNMAQNLASVGKTTGMKEYQIMGLATAMASVGIEADAGGTAMSTFASNLQLAVETGSGKLKKYAKVAGMTGKEFKAAFKEDAAGAIAEFIGGLNDAERNGGKSAVAVLDDLGITETRMRNILLSLANAGDLLPEALAKAQAAWEENVALAAEAEAAYATFANSLVIVKNKAMALGIAVYNSLREPLMNAVETAGSYMDRLNAAFEKGGFDGLVAEAGDVLGDITTQIASAAPTLIRAGTDMITGLLSSVRMNSHELGTAGADVGLALTQGVSTILPEFAKTGMHLLRSVMTGVTHVAPELTTALVDGISGFVDNISVMLPKVVSAGVDMITALTSGLIKNAPKLVTSAAKLITSVIKGISKGLPKLIKAVPGLLKDLFNAIKDVDWAGLIGDIIDACADCVAELLPALGTAFADIGQWLGETDWGAVWNGLVESFDNIGGRIKTAFATLVNSLFGGGGSGTNLLDAASMNWGELLSQAWTNIKTKFSTLNDTILTWAGATSWGDLLSKAWENIKTKFGKLNDTILTWAGADDWGGVLAKIWDALSSIVNRWIDSLLGGKKETQTGASLFTATDQENPAPSTVSWGVLLDEAWTNIKTKFGALNDTILTWAGVGSWGELLDKAWTNIKDTFGKLNDTILTWAGVGSWGALLDKAWTNIKDTFGKLNDTILTWAGASDWGEVLGNIWNGIKAGFAFAQLKIFMWLGVQSWGEVLGNVWNGIKSAFATANQTILDWFGAKSWSEVLYKVWSGVKTALGNANQSILDWFGAKDWGEVVGKIWDAIASALQTAGDTITGWFTGGDGGADSTGESFDVVQFGTDVITGITGMIHSAYDAIGAMLQKTDWTEIGKLLGTVIKGALGAIWLYLSTFDWSDIGDLVLEIFTDIMETIKGLLQGLGLMKPDDNTVTVNGEAFELPDGVEIKLKPKLPADDTWMAELNGKYGIEMEPVIDNSNPVMTTTGDTPVIDANANITGVGRTPATDTIPTVDATANIIGVNNDIPQGFVDDANNTFGVDVNGNITSATIDPALTTAPFDGGATDTAVKLSGEVSAIDATVAIQNLETEFLNIKLTVNPPDMSGMVATFASAMNSLWSTANSTMTNIKTAVSTGMNNVKAVITSVDLSGAGENMMKGLRNGILRGQSAVVTAAKSVAQAAADAIKSTLEIASPSKVADRFGGYFSMGFAQGIADMGDSVEAAAVAVAERARRGMDYPDVPDESDYGDDSRAERHVVIDVNGSGAIRASGITPADVWALIQPRLRDAVFGMIEEDIITGGDGAYEF